MIWLWIGLAGTGVTLLALAYWHLILAEGAYLGPRIVAWTYDWVARRYDAIKKFVPRHESWFLAEPLLRALDGCRAPLILDVATGTGRLPLALWRSGFTGQVIGLDLSRGMLRQARANLRAAGAAVGLLWQNAAHLPFGDGVFDAVTCLEALEFLPRPCAALAEMVRVLAPGGVLLVTNRVGPAARWLPGRAFSRHSFVQELAASGLVDIEVRRWQSSYDLAMARKQGAAQPRPVRPEAGDWPSLLCCPVCHGRLRWSPSAMCCVDCGQTCRIVDGTVLLGEIRRSWAGPR